MGVSDAAKADTDVRREMQQAALRYDVSTARKLKDIVLHELGCGVSAEYIATKYGHLGASLERVKAFKAALDKQAEKQREREQDSTGSDCGASAIG